MHAKMPGGLLAGFLLLLVPTQGFGLDLPRSGHPIFDRVVTLVADNFHDPSALDGFGAAVRQELDGGDPLNAKSTEPRVDAAIERILASLDASHTARFTQDSIAYYELADIFRYAIRHDMKRLFPPDGRASYAGVGMVTRMENGLPFVSDVYDGSPADKAGIRVGDEVLSVDGAPYREIESFRGRTGQKVEIRLRRNAGAQPFTTSVAVERLRPLPTFEKAIENLSLIHI